MKTELYLDTIMFPERVRGLALRLALCLLAVCAPPAAANPSVAILDAMTYASVPEARAAWVARDNAPPVRLAPHHARGVIFPCPFAGGADRFFWDARVSMNLAEFNGFEIDLSCEQPGGIRALSIYLKSGTGWYYWSGSIPMPGRQILTAMKRDFQHEGNPAGWNRIEAIRISPWKGDTLNTALTIHAIEARNNAVAILQGTRSLPDDGERSAARRATRRLSGWLQNAGIPHDTLTEDDVIAAGTGSARLLILPYNASLPSELMIRIKRFVESGGKLIVFYSSDAELARLMRFRLGPYKASATYGQYAAFAFKDPAAWHVPGRILQESWNIRPVYPADATARIIAHWENIRGENTDEPAWLAGPHGLWMTHILLDDDAPAKQQMLLGLVAHYQLRLWHRAAWLALHRAGRIGSSHSFGESISRIIDRSREVVTAQRMARTLVNRARSTFSRMLNEYEAGRYPETVDHYLDLQQTLREAYARVQEPRSGEFAGVWDHTGLGLFPGDWNRSARLLSQHGMTAVFPNIAWGYLVHYKSRHLPESVSARLHGDLLNEWIRAGKRNGLEIHAWVICWNLTGAPETEIARLRREGRLTVTADGRPYNWLNPAHPENRALTLRVIREIVTHYEIDGIHLDYIRFPGRDAGYDDYTRAVFESHLGRRIARWPADVLRNGPLARDFEQWRTDIITDFVKEIHGVVKSVKPGVRLSAAVFGSYPECIRTQAQDWGHWLKRGYVDFVAPMNYTADPGEFHRLLRAQEALPNARGRIYPGIGVTSNESQLTADQVIDQILVGREFNCPGYVLFDLDPTLRDKILPYLSYGISRRR